MPKAVIGFACRSLLGRILLLEEFENEEIHVLTSVLAAGTCKRGRLIPLRQFLGITSPFVHRPSCTPRLVALAVVALLSVAAFPPHRARATRVDDRQQTLTVEARDLITDVPIADLSLDFRMAGDMKLHATTDANGRARFVYELPEVIDRRSFFVTAHRAGLVPLAARWVHQSTSSTPPKRLLFLTEKATTISGRVLDEEGWPLGNARAVVNIKKHYPRTDQWVDLSYETTETDANGRWSFAGVPEQPDSVEVGAYSYLCLTERSTFFPEPFKPASALRDGTAILRVKRGTPIKGTVLAPDGRPVAGAEVYYGEGRRFGNAIPPLKTDAQGRFTLGIKPGTASTLAARAHGFGPTVQRLKVADTLLRVSLTLPPAHTIKGRVVDRTGKPIVGANVTVSWRGPETSAAISRGREVIAEQLTTDADGQFHWDEAPSSGVQVNVGAGGFVDRENVPFASDVDQQVVLQSPTHVRGTVVDRETGQPVPDFSITLAAAWLPESPFIWQRGPHGIDEAAKKAPGSFECSVSRPAHRYLLRIEAQGYLPEDAEPFAPDGTARALTFRLTRAEPIRGTVRNPDGSPARDGFVYLVPPHSEGWIEYLDLSNDDVPENDRSHTVHAKVGADGRFLLSAQKGNFALLALTEAGYARVLRCDLHGNDVLRLQPWARVTGSVTIDGKPAMNVDLQSYDPEGSAPIEGEPRLVRRFYVKTGADGRFALPRVMPGRLSLGRWVPNGVPNRTWFVAAATLDVESGRAYDMKIGRSGRAVAGRLVLPTSDTWMVRKAEIVSQAAKTDRPITTGVEVEHQGRFRALDLAPGDYALRVALHEPPPGDSCGWGLLLSEYTHRFSVPEGTTASNDPLDLGTLEPVKVGGRPLQAGDRAPDFTIKTLDGHDLTLADFRGKYVLLDFWATWCAPCLAEMPNLKAVQERFSKDPRFALIGVSLDDHPREATSMVKSLNMSWLQGIAEPESPVVSAYGATAIPATFFIGPDGKILARDLRGEKTKTAVAEVLKP